MQRQCDICGKEDWDKYMESYCTGSKTVWMCWECYKNAQREATLYDMKQGNRIRKMSEARKKKK